MDVLRTLLFLGVCTSCMGNTEMISPCPRLFSYEPQKERDRWYGVVTLISDSELSGVWLRLIFDRPALQLGNWFGEAKTTDNKEFLVKNREHVLHANMPYALRFYLKYNPSEPPPRLVSFKLNAKTVCPEGFFTTARPPITSQIFLSNPIDVKIEEKFKPPEEIECGTVARRVHIRRQKRSFFDYEENNEDHWYHHHNHKPFFPKTTTESASPLFADFDSNKNKNEYNKSKVQPRPLITFGHATVEGEFPWHAALYQQKGRDLKYICGSSLISNLYVVTVAHCVTQMKTRNVFDPDTLLVKLGKYFLTKWSNTGVQDHQVRSIIVHSDYNPTSYADDIALIRLRKPAEFTDYVRPICLWDASADISTVVNKSGTIVGWGVDETGRVSEELTQAKMPVVSIETCIYSFPEFFSRFTTTRSYCAGYRNGTSVCNGDSGGGMVFLKPSSTDNNQVWHLRGLVSISVATQNSGTCDLSHYVVFTDAAKYSDWIRREMRRRR